MADKLAPLAVTELQSGSSDSHEKEGAQDSRRGRIHEFQETEGYIIDIAEDGSASTGLKLAKDGHTVLIPQPSDDKNDPLNWTWNKKHLMLLIVSWVSFLPDYGSATGAVALIPQAVEWETTPDTVNHSQAGNVFMLGAGGVVVVILSAYFGRLPVVFWFLLISLATAAWCAQPNTFESFMAARILNGFFSTVSQAGGLMFIKDMFFFHEQARKINIWASFIVMSPYVGPLFAAFITETLHWSVPFWVYFAMNVLGMALVIAFLEETYYDRSIPSDQQPARGNRFARLIGTAQWKSRHLRNTLGQACWRTVSVLLKPVVALSCVFYALTFAWAVGINTTLAIFVTPLYGFGPKQVGFFYFTPVIAVALGEVTGHWLHDALAKQYIRSHKGHFEPEVRLRAVVLAMPVVIVGLALIGQCFENQWHFMVTSVCWGLYPEASGEVSAWLNMARTVGGFIVSYFQVRWAEAQGTKQSFGIQAALFQIPPIAKMPKLTDRKLRRKPAPVEGPKTPPVQATPSSGHHNSQQHHDPEQGVEQLVDHTEQLPLRSKRTRRLEQKLARKKRTSTDLLSLEDLPFELLDAILLCLRPRDLVALSRVSKDYRDFIQQEGPRIANSVIELRYPCLAACFLRPVLLENIEDRGVRRHMGHPKVTNRFNHAFHHIPAPPRELVCSCPTCYHRWNALGLLVDFAHWQDHLDKGEAIPRIYFGHRPEWNTLLLNRNMQIVLKGICDPLWYACILEKHLESTARAIRRQVLNKSNKRQHYRLTNQDTREGTDHFLKADGPPTIDYPYHRDSYYMLEAYMPNRSWIDGQWVYLPASLHERDVTALINHMFPVSGGERVSPEQLWSTS
ncbi:major facilitator superfamily domain-containing protein [Triangularia setosa]|uniref:Major facilitator superfamily domain-containing protein n=1 Tax=Triangularia setosa TaxID=2587417 RepID=A0AAN6W3B4_9PEZI|nr:major facilitator superfamily domain-containing protein [Podospora setosa]